MDDKGRRAKQRKPTSNGDRMAKKGLGRGLSGLIPQAKEVEPTGGMHELPIGKIFSSRWQPRLTFNDQKLAALADSIREQGLVQPVIVRHSGKDDDRYELIAGERRLRAVTMLGWEMVKACVIDATDTRMRELALVENLQRDDLNAIEIAHSYELLQKEEGLTHEQIAERLGVSRASITNTLRLLKLPGEIKQMVAEESLSAGHARTLLSLGDALSQLDLAKRILREQLPVQEVERIVKRLTSPAPAQEEKKATAERNEHAKRDRFVVDLEQRLRSHLGVKVKIDDNNGSGRIEIEYYSRDDIARLLERLGLTEEL